MGQAGNKDVTASPSVAEPASGGPPSSLQRRGTCRICFEDGEDVIKPCACDGTSKWIHRECLNRWRVSTANPRSLTNCCECGFQYCMRLDRVMSTEGEERRRRFMRRLGAQGVFAFLVAQLAVVALGMIVRAIDHHEALVEFFDFPQDKGQDQLGNFWHAVAHHKITYYVAGMLTCFLIIGFVFTIMLLVASCFPASRGRTIERDRNCLTCIDCSHSCLVCCEDPCVGACDCNHFVGANVNDLGSGVAILLVIVIAFVLVGIVVAIAAMVAAIQKAVKEYAQIRLLGVLAEEYVVQDLADKDDFGDVEPSNTVQHSMTSDMQAPHVPIIDPAEQAHLQRQITVDIEAIYRGTEARKEEVPYGSV